jgi:hypothetical protein
VVVREDHIEAQGLGPQQRFAGGDTVVHGHQQPHPLAVQALHHGGIEAVAILLAAGDGRLGPGPRRCNTPTNRAVLVMPSAS